MVADILNVRDEGFTVLAEGRDPIAESFIQNQVVILTRLADSLQYHFRPRHPRASEKDVATWIRSCFED
jgi:hypothetical protein